MSAQIIIKIWPWSVPYYGMRRHARHVSVWAFAGPLGVIASWGRDTIKVKA